MLSTSTSTSTPTMLKYKYKYSNYAKSLRQLLLLIIFIGTRYLRRGVDGDGHVANYVETELVNIFIIQTITA